MKQNLRKLWLLALFGMMSVASAWADATVSSAAELKTAIEGLSEDGQTITLGAKITLEEDITASHSFTLDLGSYTLTYDSKDRKYIILGDGVTIAASKSMSSLKTEVEGNQVCVKKVAAGYEYKSTVPVAQYSTVYHATLADAITYATTARTITLLGNASLDVDVDCPITTRATSLTIKQGDYSITANGHKIYLERDAIGGSDKDAQELFAVKTSDANCELITLDANAESTYRYQSVYKYEAQVNGTDYSTLADAVSAANGETITLMKDDIAYTMAEGETLKVNKNGCTIGTIAHNYNFTPAAPAGKALSSANSGKVYTYTVVEPVVEFTKANGETSYLDKFPNSLSDGTYKLLADIDVTTRVTTPTSAYEFIIDLNGHTLNSTGGDASNTYSFGLIGSNKTLTIKDSSAEKTGKIEAKYGVIATGSGNTLNIEAAINVDDYFCVSTNGSTTKTATVNIKEGAKLTSGVTAVYLPGVDIVANISGGTITGKTGVELRAGKLTITGNPSITATGTTYSVTANGNGTTTNGAAIAIAQHTTHLDITANIEGGTFSCAEGGKALSIANPQNQTEGEIKVSVTGGTFTGDIVNADDRVATFVKGGTFSADPADFVADEYEAVAVTENDENVWKVGKVAITEASTPVVEDGTATSTSTKTVKDDNGETIASQTITVAVTGTETAEGEEAPAGDVTVSQVELDQVIEKVLASDNVDFGTENVTVNVELQVVAAAPVETEVSGVTHLTFDVKPEAVVTIGDATVATIELDNSALKDGAKFTFTLDVTSLNPSSSTVKVTHTSAEDETYDTEVFTAAVTEDGSKKLVTITTTHFSEFDIVDGSVSSEDDVTLVDGAAYDITSDTNVKSATYKRTFADASVNKFQPWMVPFDYTITSEDLTNFDFYKVSQVSNSAEGSEVVTTKVWIYLTPITDASTKLDANTPYVFVPKAAGDYTFTTSTGAQLKAKTADAILESSTYKFYATYENTTAMEEDPFYYVNTTNQISYGTTVTVGSYRWIVKASSGSDARSLEFSVGGDDNTTGINAITGSGNELKGEFYTIGGAKVQTPGKGVYVVKRTNGEVKKIVIK